MSTKLESDCYADVNSILLIIINIIFFFPAGKSSGEKKISEKISFCNGMSRGKKSG